MFKIKQPLFLINQTPLHAGSGSDLGIVDLPIQRERHTGFPKIEGSSLKGALRHDFEANNKHEQDKDKQADDKRAINITFGPEEGDAHAGALGFTDARLLLFPVRSVKGVFAWVTCPRVLRQFERDMKIANTDFKIDNIPNPENMDACTLSGHTTLKVSENLAILEEYAFTTEAKTDITVGEKALSTYLAETLFDKGSYWHDKIQKDIIIVSDDAFADFVQLSTEVITRTKIDNTTGTVTGGALFTEEYLPTESVMYALILAAPTFIKNQKDKGIFQEVKTNEADAVMQFFKDGLREVVQIGGSATIGKGLVRTIFNYSN